MQSAQSATLHLPNLHPCASDHPGLAFYLFVHHVTVLPLWADGVLAGCLGALAAALAFFFSLLGLLPFSGETLSAPRTQAPPPSSKLL